AFLVQKSLTFSIPQSLSIHPCPPLPPHTPQRTNKPSPAQPSPTSPGLSLSAASASIDSPSTSTSKHYCFPNLARQFSESPHMTPS
uniref:Uncharacterized protein n=1 Tax=Aegilops tauschii subsp. strangulata TaxID=200361 RepID=A0A453ED32_AEGTS